MYTISFDHHCSSSSLPTKSAPSLPPHSLNSITRHSSLCQTCFFSNSYWNTNTLYMNVSVKSSSKSDREMDNKKWAHMVTEAKKKKRVSKCAMSKTEMKGSESVVPDWIQRPEKQESIWLQFQFESRKSGDPRRVNVSVQVQRLEKTNIPLQTVKQKISFLLSLFSLLVKSSD